MNLRNELVEILINRDCASHYSFACRNGLGLLIFRSLTGYYHTKYSFDATNICIFLEIWAKSPKKFAKMIIIRKLILIFATSDMNLDNEH